LLWSRAGRPNEKRRSLRQGIDALAPVRLQPRERAFLSTRSSARQSFYHK
jgi:hypothetical protein